MKKVYLLWLVASSLLLTACLNQNTPSNDEVVTPSNDEVTMPSNDGATMPSNDEVTMPSDETTPVLEWTISE